MIGLLTFLSIEVSAAIIALCGAVLVISVTIFIFTSTRKQEDKATSSKKVYSVRGKYFAGLISVLVILLIISMSMLPYSRFKGKPDKIVSVVGQQWYWKMAHGKRKVTPKQFKGKNEITVPVHQVIQFDVTSQDVNHDFAIYNSDGVILKQVMSMPEYTNKMQYTFADTGTYYVQCLEYCGMPHGFMRGEIHVK